jgi:hypothetical protein
MFKNLNLLIVLTILISLTIYLIYYKNVSNVSKFTTGQSCTGTDPNAVYTYNSTNNCVINNCKLGYEINDAGTSCKKIVPGETCSGLDVNGNYKYDSDSVCNLVSCKTNYVNNFGMCQLVGSVCDSIDTDPNGTYTLNASGDCVKTCNANFVNINGLCTWKNTGPCDGPNPGMENGTYVYGVDGNCKLLSCNFGYKNENNKCVII